MSLIIRVITWLSNLVYKDKIHLLFNTLSSILFSILMSSNHNLNNYYSFKKFFFILIHSIIKLICKIKISYLPTLFIIVLLLDIVN